MTDAPVLPAKVPELTASVQLPLGSAAQPKSPGPSPAGANGQPPPLPAARLITWSKDDEKVVEALKVGKEAVVEAVTAKGTKTKDNYSLNGFAKAYQVASKACGVKS